MRVLYLFLRGNTWFVKENDPEIVKLFGTNILPTPYTAHMPEGEVIKALKKKNPDATIRRCK